ncbi:cytochrome d ubiquinol oxidase subunit II [Zunongwangia sp.]|uniref:cytochrome d ubiquinol oxidase subunit II n=1 Tax=Zunongwangia sp. TaxID=1965325 RepID=UPI003AA7F30D
MLYVVLFFLLFALLLYVLLGGADFGAGIVELFSSKENKKVNRDTIYRVMGPIWEANHIWLIILLVILWVGFPIYFNIMTVYLHIPLTLVLLGITMRGVSFVFRHYDAYHDNSQLIYNGLFRISSFLTPVFLGMCFAALVGGKLIITSNYENYSFYELYVAPWFNVFSILMGLFYAALCGFLASTLLIGESDGNTRKMYISKSKTFTVVLVVLGFILISYGFLNNIDFIRDFVSNPISVTCVIISAILLIPLWKYIRSGRRILSRYFAGIQVVLIMFAALIAHFPNVIITSNKDVNLLADIAPNSVITVLGVSLIIGGTVILPGLFHLMKSFKMIKILDKEEQVFKKE